MRDELLLGILLLLFCGGGMTACVYNTNPLLIEPLNRVVRMTLPPNTTTVGQATLYVLEPTGYQFAVGTPASRTAVDIALLPVPPAAFNGQGMQVKDALLMLIGAHHRLLVDDLHHLISFDNGKGELLLRDLTKPSNG